MEIYVIVREDGKYVAPGGQESSYVTNLKDAQTYMTREEAQRNCCPENERVSTVSAEMGISRY